MTEMRLPLAVEYKECKLIVLAPQTLPTKWNLVALLGVAGSALLAIIGLLMNFASYFYQSENFSPSLNKIGIALICIAFPLAFWGAHALDKISEYERLRAAHKTDYQKNQSK